jgi:hypothetical protein
VNYIKQGWINRNRVLINSSTYTFTVPLMNASQNRLIMDVRISPNSNFNSKLIKQLTQSYKKAPYFEQGICYVEEVLNATTDRISLLAAKSVECFFDFVEMDKKFYFSSLISPETCGIDRSDRLIQLSKQMGAKNYINAIGGAALYDKAYFLRKGIQLEFLSPELLPYKQVGAANSQVGLSVIDALMHLSKDELHEQLDSYVLT